MMEELTAASNHLRAALERYTRACWAVQSCLNRGNITNGSVPQELSDRIGNELQNISSYEADIKQAKTAINISRNCLPAIVPANILPSEILGYIFQLVHDAQPCSIVELCGPRRPLPIDLDRLIHVCTRWRQIAISSHALWSHIDIVPGRWFSTGLLSRAEAYAARAAHCFLDIDICDFSQEYMPVSAQPDYTTLGQFLRSVAARTRSLSLTIEERSPAPLDLYHSISQAFFPICTPGVFTQLTIMNFSPEDVLGFIGTTESTDHADILLLDLPQTKLEEIWLPVKVLRLNGLYPRWTSKAYHGLVELHLSSNYDTVPITESQLINILVASPKLQTLYIGIVCTDLLPRDDPTFVQLKDLEVLVWSSVGQLGRFLQWLAPGKKPLQVSIQNSWGVEDEDGDEDEVVLFKGQLKEFFARSNVTKLHLCGWYIQVSLITEILGLVPSLQALALEENQYLSSYVWSGVPAPCSSGASVRSAHLDALYLMNSSIGLDELRLVVEKNPVQMLALWRCEVYHSQDSRRPLDDEVAEEQLHSICPSVQFNEFNPIQDWDCIKL